MVGVATATKTLSTIARFRRLCTSLKTNSQSGYTLFTSLPREHAMHCKSCGNISKCMAKSLFTLERKHTSQTLLYFKFCSAGIYLYQVLYWPVRSTGESCWAPRAASTRSRCSWTLTTPRDFLQTIHTDYLCSQCQKFSKIRNVTLNMDAM